MALYSIAYRMTVYAPQNAQTNPGDNVVLTPVAGAVHSDAFQVTTLPSLAGYKPYLGIPSGRTGRFDPIKRSLDSFTMTVNVLDQRTTVGGSNLTRWVSAFVGDSSGKIRFVGNKAFLEISLDGGTTWSPFFCGRIYDFKTVNPLEYQFVIRDGNDAFQYMDLFKGLRNVPAATSYENFVQILPFGLTNGYGPIQAAGYLSGSIQAGIVVPFNAPPSSAPAPVHFGNLLLKVTQPNGPQSSSAMLPFIDANGTIGRYDLFPGGIQQKAPQDIAAHLTNRQWTGKGPLCHVKKSNGTTGVFRAPACCGVAFGLAGVPFAPGKVTYLLLEEVTTDTVGFMGVATGTLPVSASFVNVGDQITFYVLTGDGDPTPTSPMFLNKVHPLQFLRDICSGSFSLHDSATGNAMYNIPVSASQFEGLIATTGPKAGTLWKIEKAYKMKDFIEPNILLAFNYGIRMEPLYSGSNISGSGNCGVSAVYPFDCSLPTSSVGLKTITEQDMATSAPLNWDAGLPKLGLEYDYYMDEPLLDPRNPATFTTVVGTTPFVTLSLNFDNIYANHDVIKIDSIGMRFIPAADLLSVLGIAAGLGAHDAYTEGLVHKIVNDYTIRMLGGAATIKITCQRNTNTSALRVGDFCVLNIDQLPDPVLHTKGGTRLVQCIERIEQGVNLSFNFLDTGANIVTAPPTVGSFSAYVNDTKHTIAGAITTPSASEAILGKFYITTSATGSRPDDSASGWFYTPIYARASASAASESITNLPAGYRVWPGFRAQPLNGNGLQMPSSWAYPANGFVDLTGLTAPQSVSFSSLTYQSAFLSWSNAGDSSSLCEVSIQPSGSVTASIAARLPAGSTFFGLFGLTSASADNPYTASLRHFELSGGTSAYISTSFTCSGSAPACPATLGITVLSTGFEQSSS